jgi:hypothetical protein
MYTKQEKQDALESLRKMLKPGDTVYTVLRNVSRSGMSRRIDAYKLTDNRPEYLSNYMAVLLDQQYPKDGLKVGGCGMDMGFWLVYTISHMLYRDGFGVEGTYPNGSKGRPTTREIAAKAVAKGAEFFGRNGDPSGWDTDGGYALKQAWL